jgi:hypothetical protein
MRDSLNILFQIAKCETIVRPTYTLYQKNNPDSLEIIDESALSSEYFVTQEPALDRKKLVEDLRNNREIIELEKEIIELESKISETRLASNHAKGVDKYERKLDKLIEKRGQLGSIKKIEGAKLSPSGKTVSIKTT